MDISKFVTGYFYKPFTIWAIFFNIITHLVFIPAVFGLVQWILESQVYLAIFIPSFVFSYLRQLLPAYKVTKDVKKAKSQDKWLAPQFLTYRIVLDISLWLSAVLFFVGLLMSFGVLDHNAIANKEKYSQLQFEIPMLGFIFLPAVSSYYFMQLDNLLQKHNIKLCKKIDPETMIPVISLSFFITLSYVALTGN